MAVTEKLLVKLDADVKGYIDGMDKADKGNKNTTKSGNAVSGSMSKIGSVASVAAGAIAGLAAGAVALGTALTAMALNAADNRKELERFARQAKTTASEFQALSFATSQFGIDADSLADITKDISDRLGEFATAGTGTFQDFADVMGLTASEARETALAMQEMSGQDAIQYMVSQMESAGASTNQVTFVLESMGSELSRLTPLFAENGTELDRITDKYNKFAGAVNISEQEAKDLAELNESFGLLKSSFENAATAISATLAPTLNSFINSVLEVVPDATETIIDFVNSFKGAEDQQNIDSIIRQVEDLNERIRKNTITVLNGEEAIAYARKEGLVDIEMQTRVQVDRAKEQNELDQIRIDNLTKQREELEKQTEAEAKRREGGLIEGKAGDAPLTDENGKIITAEQAAEEEERLKEVQEKKLAMMAEFAMTREEALIAQYEREAELLREYQNTEEGMHKDLSERKLEIGRKFRDDMVKLKKSEVKTEEEAGDKKESSLKSGLQVANLVGAAMFEDNKAVNAGLVVANTGAAIMESLKINPYDYGNVAVLALTGAVQLANVLGAQKGGGSTSGASGGGGTSITNRPEDFEQETTTLDVRSVAEGQSSSTQRVSLSVDDSEDFLDALAEKIATRTRAN